MMRVAGGPLVVVGLLLSLLAAPSAQGYPFSRALNLSYALAVRWWDREPEQCAEIDKEIVPDGSLGIDVAAVATVPPLNLAPHSVPCELFFDRQFAALNRLETTCVLMIHEVGHLLGYEHSEDSRSPMYSPGPLMNQLLCMEAGWLAGRREYSRVWLLADSWHG